MEGILIEQPIDSTYIVGPGDAFEVLLEDHNVVAQISPEGTFFLDEVGGAHLAGLPLAEAKKQILQLVTRKYNPKLCFVHLVKMKPLMITILGAVIDPRQVSLPANLRTSWAMPHIGGYMAHADRENVIIVRNGDTIHANLAYAEIYGDRSQDPILQTGDMIYVPLIDYSNGIIQFNVDGTTTLVKHVEGRSLIEAIQYHHSLRNDEKVSGFLYKDSTEKGRFISLAEAVHFKPQKNSTVEFLRVKNTVTVSGAVTSPGAKPYQANWTAMDYIASAGITPNTGDLSMLTIIRANGNRETIDATSTDIQPGDLLDIPRSRYESTKDFMIFLSTVTSIFLTIIVANSYIQSKN